MSTGDSRLKQIKRFYFRMLARAPGLLSLTIPSPAQVTLSISLIFVVLSLAFSAEILATTLAL